MLALLAVTAVSACTADDDAAPAPTRTTASVPASVAPAKARVALEVGHCRVEPVAFAGSRWGLPSDRQFGNGGAVPTNWQGAGVMQRLERGLARYVDDGGTVLELLPADDPTVLAGFRYPCA